MRIVIAGVLVYPLVVILLARATVLGVIDAFYLAGLLVLLPTLALGQMALAREVVLERVPAYLNSGSTILMLGLASLLMGSRLVGLPALGLQSPFSVRNVVWTGALLLIGVGTLLAFRTVRRAVGAEETRLVHDLMPVTSGEKWIFAGLSLCAGFGEEVAYRGYALTALILATGSATFALILTSATFGVLHAYQGPIGLVRTGVMGLIMGAVFLHTGSLWPPMVGHALIDLVAGLALREKLLS